MIKQLTLLCALLAHGLTIVSAKSSIHSVTPTRNGGGFIDTTPPLNASTKKNTFEGSNAIVVTAENRNCAPAAIEQFPRPLMNIHIRRYGGLAVHLFVSILMFLSLAELCENFFVPSLEVICEVTRMDPDVAGATLMAAASSLPAIAASLIAILFAKGDLGVSTTLGSAVLNAAGVVSVSAIFAGRVLILHRWPMCRDSFFFLISVVAMLFVIYDEVVTWYDSLILIVCYGIYVVMMVFDSKLEKFFLQFECFKDKNEDPSNIFQAPPVTPDPSYPVVLSATALPFDTGVKDGKPPVGDLKLSDRPNLGHLAEGGSRRRMSLISLRRSSACSEQLQKDGLKNGSATPACSEQLQKDGLKNGSATPVEKPEQLNKSDEDKVAPSPFKVPKQTIRKITWFIMLPLSILFYYTIPNCKKPRRRKFFSVTFCMSSTYIGICSYLLVWMIAVIGFTLGISDTVMGLTFLSIGVTLPDVVASLLVVRKGLGDMAVCNALGSNTFEILIGLGLPWIIKTGMMNPGTVIVVESRGLIVSTVCLLATVFFLLILTHFNKWKMNKKYGFTLMAWYLVFMVFSTLCELNVFWDFSPQTCDSDY